MFYETYTAERFFTESTTEAEARTLLWRSRIQGKEFQGTKKWTLPFFTTLPLPLPLKIRNFPQI